MSTPTDLRYSASHEWVRVEADGSLSVGITDHAQQALGDVVFLELPEAGRVFAKAEAIAVIESVKAASDIYAPVAGEILEANEAAVDAPESVNTDAYGTWLFRIKPANPADVDDLLDADAYTATLG